MFAYIFLDETLTERQFLAFVILIIGALMISVKHTRFYYLREVWYNVRSKFGYILGGWHASTSRLAV